MNCGCEYTSFSRFRNLEPYSRYEHSLGVALIIWHFTGNITQSLAGLLHDVATPVFAHVVDFMCNDHLKQEAKHIYNDLIVLENEVGEAEIGFQTMKHAERFGQIMLRCAATYISAEDRYAMQMLSELLKEAMERKLFSESDLYSTEAEIK